jgi:hypothetical protein
MIEEPTVDLSYLLARVHDLNQPMTPLPGGALRTAFPISNRGAPMRKFHLRTFLTKQAEADIPFATTARDFQLLLYAADVLPEPMLTRLCTAVLAVNAPTRAAREEAAAALAAAQRALCEYAGVNVPA